MSSVIEHSKMMNCVCPNCGEERVIWRSSSRKKGFTGLCRSCYLEGIRVRLPHNHTSWKGGRTVRRGGYIWVHLEPNDPFYIMVNRQGYVMEHRVAMARHLNRALRESEVVHHINRELTDNTIDNLLLYKSNGEHMSKHMQEIWARRKLCNE